MHWFCFALCVQDCVHIWCIYWNKYILTLTLTLIQIAAKSCHIHMMASSNGNIFRVTGHLCGEFTGHRWIPHTKASDAEPWCFLSSASQSWGWYLRRDRSHHDVIIINMAQTVLMLFPRGAVRICVIYVNHNIDNVLWAQEIMILSNEFAKTC